MRISIVTPSFNQARFIKRTIDSVLSQRGDFELEYRVVDGGSTDGTVELLQSYGKRLTWTSEPDRGQVDAINKGLSKVTGDIASWLNSDDTLLPGALQRIAAVFEQHPETEWVHGRCTIIDEHDREARRWINAYKHFRSRTWSLESFLTENFVSQMTVYWRKTAQDAIGLLDSRLRYAFDYDFFLRLAHRGAPIYLEDPTACFRWYETSKSGTGYVVQMTETADLASASPEATAWTRVRAQAKKTAIIQIYRALGVARGVVSRLR
jgi:glycosyltransferase involved in cell wall biosynthesis